jgi:hypothetical protein
LRDRAFPHKPDPVHTSLRNLKLDMRDHGRALGKLRSSLQTPTHPIYPTDPDDPIETQIAWRGEKRAPFYYRNGAWHPFGGAQPFAVASYFGTIASGSLVAVNYDTFVTSDADYFSMSSGKLHVLAEGMYEFIQWADVIPSGSPAASSEVILTETLTAETFGSIPIGLYWPDFGQRRVVGVSNLHWYPHVKSFRSYSGSFPTDQQLLFTIPFATSNCIVSTLVRRFCEPLPT